MHHFSNMSSNLELLLIKSDKEDLTNLEIVKINDQNLEGSSNSQCKKEENRDNHEIEKEECLRTSSSSSLASEAEEKLKEKDEEDGFITSSPSSSSEAEEKLKEKDNEEDGFRTPTSLDHKISVLTCPLAPKKMKQSLKRRAEPYNDQYFSCRQLPLDLSKEVELLFPTKHILPLSDSYSAKKIRRDNLEPK